MIPFFVEANPYAAGIVENVNLLADGLRSAGGVVAWVVPDPEPDLPARSEFLGHEIATGYRLSGGSGPVFERLWPGMAPDGDDLVATKTAASAFFPGRCGLDQMLVDRSVDTVIVAGTVANVCCEATVRDASTLGYRTILLADGTAAVNDSMLNATLTTVYRSFGDVRTTAELLDLVAEVNRAT